MSIYLTPLFHANGLTATSYNISRNSFQSSCVSLTAETNLGYRSEYSSQNSFTRLCKSVNANDYAKYPPFRPPSPTCPSSFPPTPPAVLPHPADHFPAIFLPTTHFPSITSPVFSRTPQTILHLPRRKQALFWYLPSCPTRHVTLRRVISLRHLSHISLQLPQSHIFLHRPHKPPLGLPPPPTSAPTSTSPRLSRQLRCTTRSEETPRHFASVPAGRD